MKTNLTEVHKSINQLAQKINVPQYLLPGHEIPLEGSYIDIDRRGLLFYVTTERGQESFRYFAKDVDDLLYKIFTDATLMMASTYELKNRVEGQATRRVMFNEQERLLGVLDEKWQERRRIEIELILTAHPLDDNVGDRFSYYQKLVQLGQHPGNEWLMASEKYPPINKFNG